MGVGDDVSGWMFDGGVGGMRAPIQRCDRGKMIACLRCGAEIRNVIRLKVCGECGFMWHPEDGFGVLTWNELAGGEEREVPRGCLAVFSREPV